MDPYVLIADDDRELCALLCDYLGRNGLRVGSVHDANAALDALRDAAHRPDLLILDVMMPGKDGFTALRQLRQDYGLPVLMLSARGESDDRVQGLELGADDYLPKPCLPRELLARVRALLRRAGPDDSSEVNIDALRMAPAERRAWLGEAELPLTGAEYSLLLALARRVGHIIDKGTLTQEALGRSLERFDRSIDVHVSRLRHKLIEAATASVVRVPRIESVRGSGYVLTRDPAETGDTQGT
ncbi:MAG TPA: response regulator transcription factor [Nevskiaceae bacterium]|nr:response regulator transcription factor [Nevskiaceae bacterium]